MNVIKYRKPDEVKDSAVEWVYRIPIDWTVCKIKHLASLKTGNSITADDKDEKYSIPLQPFYPYIGTKDIDVNNSRIEYDNGLFIPKNTKFNVANKGTTLICIEGGSAGRKIGYLEQDVCYVNKLCNLKSNDKNVNRLLYYFLKSNYFMAQFINKTTGIIPGISTDDFKNITTFLPPNIELRQIANFLNIKTAQFDSIISKKELLIQKLEEAKKSLISEIVTGKVKIIDGEMVPRQSEEMKDSGVEWLGMLPKDWKVSKLKYIANVKGRIGFRGYTKDDLVDEEDGAIVIGATQISLKGEIDLATPVYISWKKYYESPEIALKINDILLVQRGSTTGKVGIVNILPKQSTINPSLIVIKNIKIKNKFLFYFLKSTFVEKYFNSITSNTAIPMISQEQVSNVCTVLPDSCAQQVVIDYLNRKISDLDTTIGKIQSQIQKLKQAKQSLISEAVTGKIDLRDWEIMEVGEVQ